MCQEIPGDHMNDHKDYFELGRGAVLVSNDYWHQYALGTDLSSQEKQFVAMEVGKSDVIYRKKLSIDELAQKEWSDLLEISKTRSIVDELVHGAVNFTDFHRSISQSIVQKELIQGDWTSINVYSDLNYNSNFGNWVDASEAEGRLKFSLDLSKTRDNCRVDIPVNYKSMGKGYYSIKYGTFQLGYQQILIWQNPIFPAMINYELNKAILALELFQNKIKFLRD